MLEIRPFLNSDLPRLAMLWVIHHSVHRAAPTVSPAVWEQAIPSRHFFDPRRLLVATIDGEPVAWCQWFAGEGKTAHLAAICFDTTAQGESAARELLAQCQRQIVAAGFSTIFAGVSKESRWGYQGLEPIGQGIGVDVADDRTNQMLEEAGFIESKRIDRWEVATFDYRPPVSRESLVYRRGTKIEITVPPRLPPVESAAMFHFDVQRFLLMPTGGGEPLATADVWLSDPDIHVMSTHQSILGCVSGLGTDLAARESAIRYLIASLIPILAARHIQAIYRSVATDNHDEAARLAALKFHRTGAGRLMQKKC